ncbi:MAG: DNA-binding response OmpR family regulator [Bacteriovoracaceae bacterium]|jgi:DNA-binding response OmpR family regulator
MENKKIRLLVLDDSKEFVFLLTSLLTFHEIKVDTESNPESALKLTEEKDYDLIITDYMMDQMDGISFAEKIREGGINKETKIILLTAKHLENEELSLVNKIGLVYVNKPILPNDLYRKVMETIQG